MAVYMIFFLIVMLVIFIAIGFTGISYILIFSSAFVILLLIKRNFVINKTLSKVPPDELHVLNLDKGGIFTLRDVGKNAEEINLKVISKHLYRQGDYYWWELECDKGNDEHVWVEIEDDDSTVVSIVLKELSLSDIHIRPTQLDTFDDEESGNINFQGRTYKYTDSDSATFYRLCDKSKAENFYYWDFEFGKYSLNIEKWGNREYKAFSCQKMKPSQVTVYLNKEEEDK